MVGVQVRQEDGARVACDALSGLLRRPALPGGLRTAEPAAAPNGASPSDAERLVEAPEEQATIARIREERRHGRGLREIARRLDVAGIDCRGGRWSHTTVRSVLLRSAQLAERC